MQSERCTIIHESRIVANGRIRFIGWTANDMIPYIMATRLLLLYRLDKLNSLFANTHIHTLAMEFRFILRIANTNSTCARSLCIKMQTQPKCPLPRTLEYHQKIYNRHFNCGKYSLNACIYMHGWFTKIKLYELYRQTTLMIRMCYIVRDWVSAEYKK